jgi:hypothetical protein
MRPICSRIAAASFLSMAIAAAMSPVASAAIITNTSGVYDEQITQANAVDATATTPTSGSPTLVPLSTFTTDVATAFAAGTGGVINFDDVTTAVSSDTTISAKYGPGFNSTLNVSGASYQVDMSQAVAIGATPISGAIYLRNGSSTGNQSYAFDQLIKEVGVTVLARSVSRSITATVTYDDATSAAIGPFTVAANTGSGATSAPDTFFGFAAPSGKSITKLTLAAGANNFFVVDDLGFITVPEPASMGMLGVAAMAMLVRRGRRAGR